MAIGNALGKLFGKSPLRPLQEHMRKVHDAAAHLPGLVAAAQSGDWEQAAVLHKEMMRLASDADKLKLALRMDLRQSVFMPVNRSDLLELLTSQDLVADESEIIANLVMSRKITLPEKTSAPFDAFLSGVVATVDFAHSAVMELDEVFEVGFAQKEIDVVYRKLRSLLKQEAAVKKLDAKLRGSLRKVEGSIDPLEAMFIYQLVDRVGTIGRHAERIGNRLLIMISV